MAVRFEAAATAANVGRLQRASSITSAPYTVLVWMLSDAAAATGTEVFDLYSNDWSSDAWIELTSDDRAVILGTDTYTYSVNKYNYSTWHCYAMVRSGTTQTGYQIDGGVVLTRTTSTPSDFDLETLLGYKDDPNSSACAVAHYKSWHAALTLEELAKEMQQFAPVRTANLASWTKFDVHTDLSDEIAASWTAINQTPTTVAGPTGIPEEWEGPRVASSATTVGTTSAGGLSCNLPSGIVAGDLLMAHAANDTSVSWSASTGWEKIDDGANGTVVQGATWARIATGSDALTITGEANDIAVVVERIVNHGVTDVTTDIIKGTAATGSSNAPNGPNCNPGTSGKYLWITQYSADDDDDTAIWWPAEGAPVAQVKSATGTSSCQCGVAYRWLEASSYDPSAFALSASEEWRAQTFAIPALVAVSEIDPSGIASSATYGSATISNVSAQTISSSSLSSNAAFGSVTVAKVTAKNISMSGLGSNALYGTTLFANVTAKAIAPNGLASSVALGTSAINKVPAKSITPVGLTSNIVFGSSTLLNATPKDISFSGLVSNVSFGTALVAKATPKNITASGIVSVTVVGDAVIGKASPKNISPNGIASSIDFGLPDLAGISIQTITVSSIPSVATVGTQTVSKNTAKNVAVDGIVSSAVVGTHTITKINAQNISPDGITTNIQFGATFVDDGSGDIPDSSLRPLYRIAVSLGFDRR